MKPEYLMLAQIFKPCKFSMAGWYISEKLDGVRAYWDGGISRGLLASKIPYANTVKDHRLLRPPIATGLWSRTGKVINAPKYWLTELPNFPLDGELYIAPKTFQKLTSIVSTKDNSRYPDWEEIKYMVFDSPPYLKMFANRRVKVRDYDFEINGAIDWYHNRIQSSSECDCDLFKDKLIRSASVKWNFEMVQNWLSSNLHHRYVELLPQERLPFNHQKAITTIGHHLDGWLEKGAEGAILRNPISKWVPERSHMLLKHKPWLDDEAIITGFTSGKETEKGSRLLGMIGALIVNYKGKRLELSGLTDRERLFSWGDAVRWAVENPGKDMPASFDGDLLKIGQTITFKYRELSDDGVPKEARYYRKRGEE